jgi:hypothetical protein
MFHLSCRKSRKPWISRFWLPAVMAVMVAGQVFAQQESGQKADERATSSDASHVPTQPGSRPASEDLEAAHPMLAVITVWKTVPDSAPGARSNEFSQRFSLYGIYVSTDGMTSTFAHWGTVHGLTEGSGDDFAPISIDDVRKIKSLIASSPQRALAIPPLSPRVDVRVNKAGGVQLQSYDASDVPAPVLEIFRIVHFEFEPVGSESSRHKP